MAVNTETEQVSTTVGGMHRRPVLTAAVAAVTAAFSVAQLIDPKLLGHLERTNAALHGQPWRIVTSLFVQDGGVYGTLSNLVFLVLVGACAEQVLSRGLWLVHYFGVGLLAELIALSWQPTGGGNSIAVCGLTGAVVLAFRAGDAVPMLAPTFVCIWLAALVGTIGSAAYAPAIVVGIILSTLVRNWQQGERTDQARMLLTVLTLGVAVALACLENIHGAALIFSLVLSLATVGLRRNGAR